MPVTVRGPDYEAALWYPSRAHKPRRRHWTLAAVILHSGDGSRAGDLATLTQSTDVSAHYYVTRETTVYQLVHEDEQAFHAGKVRRADWANSRTIGIETEHRDGIDDWPDSQVVEIAILVFNIRRRYGHVPVLSHARVAAPPGRKVDPLDFPWLSMAAVVAQCAGNALTGHPSDYPSFAPVPRTPS